MTHRTVVAALLAGLASPALAAQLVGPAYNQAAGMAAGKNPDAAYDGSPARTELQSPTSAAPAAVLAAETSPASASAARPALTAEIPEPPRTNAQTNFWKNNFVLGVVGIASGARAGWILGGPVGAVVGAFIGFSISFAVSTLLR